MKELGPLRYFLGIEARSEKDTLLSQQKYVIELLSETGMLGCKFRKTHIELNHNLSSNEGEQVDKDRYERLFGKLLYLTAEQI